MLRACWRRFASTAPLFKDDDNAKNLMQKRTPTCCTAQYYTAKLLFLYERDWLDIEANRVPVHLGDDAERWQRELWGRWIISGNSTNVSDTQGWWPADYKMKATLMVPECLVNDPWSRLPSDRSSVQRVQPEQSFWGLTAWCRWFCGRASSWKDKNTRSRKALCTRTTRVWWPAANTVSKSNVHSIWS